MVDLKQVIHEELVENERNLLWEKDAASAASFKLHERLRKRQDKRQTNADIRGSVDQKTVPFDAPTIRAHGLNDDNRRMVDEIVNEHLEADNERNLCIQLAMEDASASLYTRLHERRMRRLPKFDLATFDPIGASASLHTRLHVEDDCSSEYKSFDPDDCRLLGGGDSSNTQKPKRRARLSAVQQLMTNLSSSAISNARRAAAASESNQPITRASTQRPRGTDIYLF